MFTPGFRLFSGFSLMALVGAFVYGYFSDPKIGHDYFGVLNRRAIVGLFTFGWVDSVGDALGYTLFIVVAAVAIFLACTLVAFRDADVEAVAQITPGNPEGEMPAAQGPAEASIWPIGAALGVGVFIVGLATSPLVWWGGLAVLAIVTFEWALSNWADRATNDPVLNRGLRRQIMGPFEVPVLAVAGFGIVALAVSQILLAVSKSQAVIIAGVLATAILLVGALLANRPELGKKIAGGVVLVSLLAVIVSGIVAVSVGPRDFHHVGEDTHAEEGEAMGVGS